VSSCFLCGYFPNPLRLKPFLLSQVSTLLGGVTWENSHRGEFHTGMTFWFPITFTITGSFQILLFEGTLHADKILVWLKIANITHALPVPVYRQLIPADQFHTETGGCLAFAWYRWRFRIGVKFSPRYNNRGELKPGLLAPTWHFVVVSCKQI